MDVFRLFPRLLGQLPRAMRKPLPNKPRIPPPRPQAGIQTPSDLLTAIGRDAETKLTVEDWDTVFSMGGEGMKKAGVAVKDRRYILWALEKYRSGGDPKQFAIPVRPKKTIRGWGPRVQNGKRIR